MQHILAMFAALENQFELCQRLLCIESGRIDTTQKTQSRSKISSNRSIFECFLIFVEVYGLSEMRESRGDLLATDPSPVEPRYVDTKSRRPQ
jgi:hypothetical protein